MTEATGQVYKRWCDAPVGRLIEVDWHLSDYGDRQRVVGMRCEVSAVWRALMLVLDRRNAHYGRLVSPLLLGEPPAIDVSDQVKLKLGKPAQREDGDERHVLKVGKAYSLRGGQLCMHTQYDDDGPSVEYTIELSSGRCPVGLTSLVPHELIVERKAAKQE